MAAAAIDLRVGRVPNALVPIALGGALLAEPGLTVVIGALVAPLPLLTLATLRLTGMGDVKLAVPIGALLVGQLGLGAVPWWWAWSLLAAAVTLTLAGLFAPRRTGAPLAPALVAAAAVSLLTG